MAIKYEKTKSDNKLDKRTKENSRADMKADKAGARRSVNAMPKGKGWAKSKGGGVLGC